MSEYTHVEEPFLDQLAAVGWEVIDHLRYLNHTQAFWDQVAKVLPDYRDRRKWLRVNGAGMDL